MMKAQNSGSKPLFQNWLHGFYFSVHINDFLLSIFNCVPECSIPGPKYDTSGNMVWNKRTRTLKAKLETSPYRPKPRDHLTCSLGSAAYKVEYHETGRHAPSYTIGSRFGEPIIFGPPNIAVEPVDTKGSQYFMSEYYSHQ